DHASRSRADRAIGQAHARDRKAERHALPELARHRGRRSARWQWAPLCGVRREARARRAEERDLAARRGGRQRFLVKENAPPRRAEIKKAPPGGGKPDGAMCPLAARARQTPSFSS